MTKLLNARILASIGMLVFVGAIVASATGAFFSDTETSTGNTFTAGDVTIGISGLTHVYNGDIADAPTFTQDGFAFALGDLKPLDEGTISYGLQNGSNDAYLCAAVVETGNAENGRNGPEIAAGDITDDEGELGQFLSFNFGTTTGTLAAISGVWQPLGTISGGGSASSSISYCFGEYSGSSCQLGSGNYNLAQTDSLTADVHFYAVQTRNNPDFTCASLPPVGTTTPPTEPFSFATNTDVGRVASQGTEDFPNGSTFSLTSVYGADLDLTIQEVGANYVFTATTPFVVAGAPNPDDSVSILFDADGDGVADFQFAYSGTTDVLGYQEVIGGSWTSASAPAGFSATSPSGTNTFVVTIPTSAFETIFKVGVNATDNGSVHAGTHTQMSIAPDIFGSGFTSSVNYIPIDTTP